MDKTKTLEQIAKGDCLNVACYNCPIVAKCIRGNSEYNAQVARRLLAEEPSEEITDYELSRLHDEDLERRRQEIYKRMKGEKSET